MFSLPKYVKTALEILKSAGFEAYAVGGCVRDMMLSKVPDDYDITTNALPEETAALFSHTVLSGIKHGTVTVIIDSKPIEITTYRSDGSYSNHRSPDKVSFINDIGGDLARRDFTVNAMAFDGENKIIDLFGGKEDLKNGIIRAVGNPYERFKEDALRILRALRFSAKLGFSIEENTLNAIIKEAFLLKEISRERIFAEISKILTSENPQILQILANCGGMSFLGIDDNCTLADLSAVKGELPIRFYAFCILAKVNAVKLCGELKTDGDLLKYCKNMDCLFALKESANRIGIKKMLYKTDFRAVNDYLSLTDKDSLPLLKEIIDLKEPYLIKDLAVNGKDITDLGYSGGDVGKILEKLLYRVMENPAENKKEYLLQIFEI